VEIPYVNHYQQNLEEIVVDALKQKIIDEFEKFLKRLQLGYVDDYKKILHEISFI
jgi:hypothetical protein